MRLQDIGITDKCDWLAVVVDHLETYFPVSEIANVGDVVQSYELLHSRIVQSDPALYKSAMFVFWKNFNFYVGDFPFVGRKPDVLKIVKDCWGVWNPFKNSWYLTEHPQHAIDIFRSYRREYLEETKPFGWHCYDVNPSDPNHHYRG